MLLAGKPLLLVPNNLERRLIAERVVEQGAGVVRHPKRPNAYFPALKRVLADRRFTQAARQFADKYAGINPADRLDEMVRHLEQLAGSQGPWAISPRNRVSRKKRTFKRFKPATASNRVCCLSSRWPDSTLPEILPHAVTIKAASFSRRK